MIQLGIDVTRARVTILGFTYKEDCPDIRNTKVADLIKELENYKIKASIYDPLAHKDEVKHEYGYEIHSDLPRTPAHCLVIAVNHKPYRDLTIKQLKKMLHKDGLLIDIKSCFDQNELRNAGIHFYSL